MSSDKPRRMKRPKKHCTELEKAKNIKIRAKSGRGRGRPPKKQTVQFSEEINDELANGTLTDSSEENEVHMYECAPNGSKLIQCCICGIILSKIYELRQHIAIHKQADNYKNGGKDLEKAPVYKLLNPNGCNIETNIIRDFLIEQLEQKHYSQLYVILTEAGGELHISDSETDSQASSGDEENEEQIPTRKAKHPLIPRNTYKCELCHTKWNRRYKALFHQRTAHADEQLPLDCDYCGQQFTSLQVLIHHLKTRCESDEYPISCVERFRQHLLKVNLEQFEGLAQARKELKEQRVTTAARLYSCNVCEKTFLRSEHLSRHKSVHLPDELKIVCPVCYRKFNRRDNLRSHMKVHMDGAARDAASQDQTPILCQHCGHCFTDRSNYVVHMRRHHTGEKPYVCDVCGKGYAKSSDLKSHKRTHTGEREYSCSVCSKTFARASMLSKHMHVHGGPYHCTYCEESFQRPTLLTQHLHSHTEETKPLKIGTNKQDAN